MSLTLTGLDDLINDTGLFVADQVAITVAAIPSLTDASRVRLLLAAYEWGKAHGTLSPSGTDVAQFIRSHIVEWSTP